MTSLTWTFPNNLQSHRRKEGQTPSLSNRMVLCLISVTSLFSLSMKHFAIDSSKRVVQIHGQLQSLILFQQIIFFFCVGSTEVKFPLAHHEGICGRGDTAPCIQNLTTHYTYVCGQLHALIHFAHRKVAATTQ